MIVATLLRSPPVVSAVVVIHVRVVASMQLVYFIVGEYFVGNI